MFALVSGSLLLSLLHAIIPSHWLPVLAIARKEGWSLSEILNVTIISGLSHMASTLLIGWGLAYFGWELSKNFQLITPYISPVVLIVIGLVFIYRHHRHKHFHVDDQPHRSSKTKMIFSLSLAMFFSPCLEIEAYFLVAGSEGLWFVALLAVLYTIVTVSGMVIWVRLAYNGLLKMNWHSLEHNAGIITGITLVLSGILTFFLH